MSRYNHFGTSKYKSISFNDVKIGDRFRMDKFNGKRRRADIIMIKISETSYKEVKSGKEYNLNSTSVMVSDYKIRRRAKRTN